MIQSKSSILAKSIYWISISKAVTQIFAFIVQVLVMRKLSVDDFGVYSLLLSTFLLFDVFGLSPVVSVFNRYIPEYSAKSHFHKVRRIILYGSLSALLVLAMLLGFLFLFKNTFAEFFHLRDFEKVFWPYIIFICGYYFRQLLVGLGNSLLLQKDLSIINIVQSIISPVIYLIYLRSLDIQILLLIEVVLSIVIIFPAIIIVYKYLQQKIGEDADHIYSPAGIRRRVFTYGILSAVNELGAGVIGRTSDFYIISAMSNPYYTGLYGFANRIYNLVARLIPIQDFMTVLNPLFIQKYSIDNYDKNEFTQVFNLMIKVFLPVYVLPALYFLVFGKNIIEFIFGAKYIEAYWTTFVVLLSNILIPIFNPLGLTMRLKERMDIAVYSKIVVVFSIFAGIYSMSKIGIIGVALTSLIGEAIKCLFIYVLMNKNTEITFNFREYRNIGLVAIVTGLIFGAFACLVANIFGLVLWSIAFVLFFIFCSILLHPFNEKDLAFLDRITTADRLLQIVRRSVLKIYRTRYLLIKHL